MEQDMKTTPLSSLETEAETKESFRQNASFDEKILLVEGIFSTYSDDHDIKKMTRGKIENMLYAAKDEYSYLEPDLHLGRKAINQWIWRHMATETIPLEFFKEYLQSIIDIDAWYYYQEYKTVEEVIKLAGAFFQKPIENLLLDDIVSQALWIEVSSKVSSSKIQRILSYVRRHCAVEHSIVKPPLMSTAHSKQREVHPRVRSFIEKTIKEGKTKSTQEYHSVHLNRLLNWLSNNIHIFKDIEAHQLPLLKVTKEHLIGFHSYLTKQVRHGRYSPITASECIYSVKAFFQYLKKSFGYPNPAFRLRSISAPRYRHREIPDKQQIYDFFRTVDKYSDNPVLERTAFRLMLDLGMRSNEVSVVSPKDIHINHKTITIHSKGGKEHVLPLSERLFVDLQIISNEYPKTQYLFGESPKKIQKTLWQNYKLYALIAGWSFPGGLHLFRHSFVTRLANKGPLPQAMQVLARVTNLDTVSLYVHFNKLELTREINKLKYD
ncbi:tyrosine-type recombinase/integrase [Paenibacillus ehimensis]|uniref:tyrosine-type recombinase/integrase n=1 Tax=Paenibacillus ehimensis TaxID=79264 RepID=UPI003D2E0A3D